MNVPLENFGFLNRRFIASVTSLVMMFVSLSFAPNASSQTISTSTSFERIHIGDFIEIDVIGSIEDDWRGKIDDSGLISDYPLLKNPIDVLCLTTAQVETILLEQLRTVLRNPKVEVKVLDRSERPLVSVSGAVRNPQRFQMLRPASLQELIVLAGGLGEDSDGSVEIIRRASLGCTTQATTPSSDLEVIQVSLGEIIGTKDGATIPISAGDIVTVRKAGFITIIGGVRSPRQIRMRSRTTVSRAIASAGGPVRRSDISKIRVYRQSGQTTETIAIDLKTTVKGKDGDIELKAGDVIEVPVRGRKSAPFAGSFEGPDRREVPPNLPLRTID